MTLEELRDYVDEQRTLNNIPYHVYSALIDGIDTLEQEPCSDAISRAYIEPIIEELENICVNGDEHILNLLADIKNAPPVNPQEPKTGHWIKSSIGGAKICSICQAHMGLSSFKFCPSCGARMESEDKTE